MPLLPQRMHRPCLLVRCRATPWASQARILEVLLARPLLLAHTTTRLSTPPSTRPPVHTSDSMRVPLAQVPDSHFGWYAPFCRCDNSTQDTSSQSGPNLGWQCVSQGVRKTSRCNARAFPAQSTDLFCALHLLLRQLQDPHLRRKSRSPKVRYALFVSSACVNTDTTLLHMTSTIADAVY